jgi:hypothetical protein
MQNVEDKQTLSGSSAAILQDANFGDTEFRTPLSYRPVLGPRALRYRAVCVIVWAVSVTNLDRPTVTSTNRWVSSPCCGSLEDSKVCVGWMSSVEAPRILWQRSATARQTSWHLRVILVVSKAETAGRPSNVVRFLAGARDLWLLQSVKAVSAAHPASCLMSISHVYGVVCKVASNIKRDATCVETYAYSSNSEMLAACCSASLQTARLREEAHCK